MYVSKTWYCEFVYDYKFSQHHALCYVHFYCKDVTQSARSVCPDVSVVNAVMWPQLRFVKLGAGVCVWGVGGGGINNSWYELRCSMFSLWDILTHWINLFNHIYMSVVVVFKWRRPQKPKYIANKHLGRDLNCFLHILPMKYPDNPSDSIGTLLIKTYLLKLSPFWLDKNKTIHTIWQNLPLTSNRRLLCQCRARDCARVCEIWNSSILL